MDKPNDFGSLNSELKITVFQALTLLAKKYRNDPTKLATYKNITALYLSGVRKQADLGKLNALLEDELFVNYMISSNKKDITDDPVRRYFESHLCHTTLSVSLDLLDLALLEQHLTSIINRIDGEDKPFILPIINNEAEEEHVNEYAEGIRHLKKSDSFQSLKPEATSGRTSPDDVLNERKNKMTLLAKSMYAAKFVPEEMNSGELIFDFYYNPEYIFAPKHRGRKTKRDHAGKIQDIHPFTLGIMKSTMPLAKDDPLYANEPSRYTRPTDQHTYKSGSYQVADQIFATKVTPFVSSISGTMVLKLRVIAQLLREDTFVYKTPGKNGPVNIEQLTHYLKSFIAYMIYNAGGHSLEEYFSVLQLQEVRWEFKSIPGFFDMTLDRLFKDDNLDAFNEALNKTIQYNDHILNKKRLHAELKIQQRLNNMINHRLKHIGILTETQPNNSREIDCMDIKAHLSSDLIGTLALHLTPMNEQYSVIDSSIVGGSLLFALVRLLNDKQYSSNQHEDAGYRFKQLLLVVCMVSIAKIVGAKILKEESNNAPNLPATPTTGFTPLIAATTGAILSYSLFQPPEHEKSKAHTEPHRAQIR